MLDVKIEHATIEHARALAEVMRSEDAAELLASGWDTPLEGLVESMRRSDVATAMSFDGEVVAIWGVGPATMGQTLLGRPRVGVAWLLTGRGVDKHPKAFIRACRPAVRQLLELYPHLVNAVDARYGRALRWARWLGFHVGGTQSFGPDGLPFHVISMGGQHGRVH